jgi:hypothetical protein
MKLTFYFKSGSVVTADKVSEWEVSQDDGKISKLVITQDGIEKKGKRIIVKSIDLRDIDCITEEP